jgi:hypothetical protein
MGGCEAEDMMNILYYVHMATGEIYIIFTDDDEHDLLSARTIQDGA